MTDTMKHFEQQTLNSVFCLVSCSSKIKFSIFQSCDWLKSDTSAAQGGGKKVKKKIHLGQVFQRVTSFETQHLFFCSVKWDILYA